jgi:uncharacterized protein YcbK (DUF882 family)
VGDLTKNISRHELKCKCGTDCGHTYVDYATIKAVQDACNYFAGILDVEKVTLIITSAARCYQHNRDIGSNDRSQHPKSSAIDHYVKGISVEELHAYYKAKYPNTFGLGLYKTFVHIDSRTEKARWDG